MVEDLIEAIDSSKTKYEGRGLDFEGVLFLTLLSLKRGMYVRRRDIVILSFSPRCQQYSDKQSCI